MLFTQLFESDFNKKSQGVAEAFANPGAGSTGTSRGAKRIANTVGKALAKNTESPEQRAARKDFEAQIDAKMAAKKGMAEDVKLPYPVRSEKLGRANMELLIRAYNEPTSPRTTLSFGDRILELDRQDIEAIAHYYDNVLKDDQARWNFITGVMSDPDGLTDTLVKLGRRKAQAARQPGLFQEADKKKEDDVKDVALQRAISKSRAAFPTATSGFEALAKQFMQDQDTDQRNFDKVKDANRRQDQLLAQISQIDKEQSQEIDDLDKENNSLVQQLQQLQSVNSKLEKTLASMSGKKSKTKDAEPKTVSVKPADELPVQKSTEPSKPQTPATAKPAALPQIAQAEPTQPSSMSSMTKQLTTQHPEVLEPAADYVRGSAPRFNTAGAQDVVAKDVANDVKQNIGSIGDAMVGDKLQQVANDELMGQSSQADDDNLPLFAKKQAAENKQQKPEPPEVDYDDPKWDAMVTRVKKLAGMGPMKTVWDPQKRVYKNVPVNK